MCEVRSQVWCDTVEVTEVEVSEKHNTEPNKNINNMCVAIGVLPVIPS